MEPSQSLETLRNIFASLTALVYSPPLLKYSLVRTPFDPLPLALSLSAFDVIFSATIERIAHPTCAPIATYPRWDILPPLVFNSNVISVITGDIMIDSVLTESVVFAIPLDTSLMTVQLNIFLPHSRPQSLEDFSSVTTRGLIIEPGARLYEGGNVTILFLIVLFYFSLTLAVYLLGEVDVITTIPLIFSFAHYLLFVSLTFLWT